MYAEYYTLEFNIILNLTSPIKVYVIWIQLWLYHIGIYIFCNFFNKLVLVIFSLDLHVLLIDFAW